MGWAFGEVIDEVKHAGRALRRDRDFLLAALLTLAFGMGATTATFSVVNAALLTPPPYPDADRLLVLSYLDGGSQNGQIFRYGRSIRRSRSSGSRRWTR